MTKILHCHYFDIPNKISTHQFDWNLSLSLWLMRSTVVTTSEQPYHWRFRLNSASSKHTYERISEKVSNPQLILRLSTYQPPWNSLLYYILERNADYSMSDTIWTKLTSSRHYLWSVVGLKKIALVQGVTQSLLYIYPKVSNTVIT